MSTFNGPLYECDLISIDCFENENLESKAFFLSHFHTDHMRGLGADEFFDLLSSHNLVLYTHELTRTLIETSENENTRRLLPFVIGRPVNHKFTVFLDDFEQQTAQTLSTSTRPYVNVTFLPARHCVGSVMMLFEFSDGKTVLYTGDFRLTADDWKTFGALYNRATGKPKKLDTVYFDSTFCDRQYAMPTRKESKDALISQVKEWLNGDQKRKVLIRSYAHFGHEFLLCALYEATKEKIHVSTEKYAIYLKFGSPLSEAVSADPSQCRIHCCTYWKNEEEGDNNMGRKRTKYTDACPDCDTNDSKLMIIKASMMIFHINDDPRVWYRDASGVYHLSYSCHSSLDEVRSAFLFLRPLRAYANVVNWREGHTQETYMTHFTHLLRRAPEVKKAEDEDFWNSDGGTFPWNARVDVQRLRQLDEQREPIKMMVENYVNPSALTDDGCVELLEDTMPPTQYEQLDSSVEMFD